MSQIALNLAERSLRSLQARQQAALSSLHQQAAAAAAATGQHGRCDTIYRQLQYQINTRADELYAALDRKLLALDEVEHRVGDSLREKDDDVRRLLVVVADCEVIEDTIKAIEAGIEALPDQNQSRGNNHAVVGSNETTIGYYDDGDAMSSYGKINSSDYKNHGGYESYDHGGGAFLVPQPRTFNGSSADGTACAASATARVVRGGGGGGGGGITSNDRVDASGQRKVAGRRGRDNNLGRCNSSRSRSTRGGDGSWSGGATWERWSAEAGPTATDGVNGAPATSAAQVTGWQHPHHPHRRRPQSDAIDSDRHVSGRQMGCEPGRRVSVQSPQKHIPPGRPVPPGPKPEPHQQERQQQQQQGHEHGKEPRQQKQQQQKRQPEQRPENVQETQPQRPKQEHHLDQKHRQQQAGRGGSCDGERLRLVKPEAEAVEGGLSKGGGSGSSTTPKVGISASARAGTTESDRGRVFGGEGRSTQSAGGGTCDGAAARAGRGEARAGAKPAEGGGSTSTSRDDGRQQSRAAVAREKSAMVQERHDRLLAARHEEHSGSEKICEYPQQPPNVPQKQEEGVEEDAMRNHRRVVSNSTDRSLPPREHPSSDDDAPGFQGHGRNGSGRNGGGGHVERTAASNGVSRSHSLPLSRGRVGGPSEGEPVSAGAVFVRDRLVTSSWEGGGCEDEREGRGWGGHGSGRTAPPVDHRWESGQRSGKDDDADEIATIQVMLRRRPRSGMRGPAEWGGAGDFVTQGRPSTGSEDGASYYPYFTRKTRGQDAEQDGVSNDPSSLHWWGRRAEGPGNGGDGIIIRSTSFHPSRFRENGTEDGTGVVGPVDRSRSGTGGMNELRREEDLRKEGGSEGGGRGWPVPEGGGWRPVTSDEIQARMFKRRRVDVHNVGVSERAWDHRDR